ncbi:type III pantothenate kinase [Biformimicrobium ophioploci]|uniref:Type III pantothenate kinase n=1 Tax=Biformimicrobium ophioploci TaxID=3036711 RepID=A0ABQ6M2T2_9GAMM|nr:type III pantothenate kinase [Microbulbifer sp. NKW57]GMG88661.1 pantothenate kinase [Microbulbifer sp. NKW57]
MQVLELDVGNTRAKWRLLEDGIVAQRGTAATGALNALEVQWAEFSPDRVRVANVGGLRVAAQLEALARKIWGLEPLFAQTSAQCAGVTCGYADHTRLGVDRWLAVLGAFRAGGGTPALVVDCGSAVTIDFLQQRGQHSGGYILPGLRLMRDALFHSTDAVKVTFDQAASENLAPGTDTQSAVNRGLLVTLRSTIEQCHADATAAAAGQEMGLYLTGGDAAVIASTLEIPYKVVPELVLDGLAAACP